MSAFLFLVSFALLLAGLSGTLPAYRDSGDLIAASHTLGIAHPPGYPVYVLIGRLNDSLLHWGNSAYHSNVFSALALAGATTLLYAAGLLWLRGSIPRSDKTVSAEGSTAKKICALTGAFCFLLTPAALALGRVAEMYALLALWAAALLALLFSQRPNRRTLAAFLLGLGIGVHPTLILIAPLFIVAAFNEDVAPTPRRPGALLLFFLLGLSIFLFLPFRAAAAPWLQWGDPAHLRGFWRLLTRADYGGLKLHPEESVLAWTPESIGRQISAFGQSFLVEFGVWGLASGLIGAWIGCRESRSRRAALGLLAAWLCAGPLFFVLSNLPEGANTTAAILQPYLVLADLLWTPFVIGGLYAVMSKARWVGMVAVLAGLFVTLRNASLLDQRSDFYAYDYARNLLRSLPQGAVLYDPDDPTAFGIRTVQATENRRQDVLLLNFFRTRWGYERLKREAPGLLPPGPVTSAQDLERIFWAYSARRRPFFGDLPQKLGPVPYAAAGLAYAAFPRETPVRLLEKAHHAFLFYALRGNFCTAAHPDFFTRHIIDYYAAAHSNLGMAEAAANHPEEAIAEYQAALAIDPELSPAYNNWAIIEHQRRNYARAIALYQTALKFDPGNAGLKINLAISQAAAGRKTP